MAQQDRDVRDRMPAAPRSEAANERPLGTGTGPHRELGGDRRRTWWIVGAVAAVAIVWIAAAGGNGNQATPIAGGAKPGTVTTSDGRDLLAMTSQPTDLASLEGQTVRGDAVPVLGFIPGSGFWVGSPAERIFVAQRYDSSLVTGDTVDFTGTLTALPSDYKTAFGVDVHSTARYLGREGVYVLPQQVTRVSGAGA